MIFQKQVQSSTQALGNAGQISKGHHSYCNVVDYVAGDKISVGEFAQSSLTKENEVFGTDNKEITGQIVGGVISDSLKHSETNEPTLELQAGSSLQIIDAGSVFIATSSNAMKGDYVLLDKFSGEIVFSKASEVPNLINTGWRVGMCNPDNVHSIIEITTTRVESNASAMPSPYAVGDLVLKDGTIVKSAEVDPSLANEALGIIAFIEQGGGRALLADTQFVTGVPIVNNTSVWWAQARKMAEGCPFAVTNAGKGAMPTWNTDLKPLYRNRAIEKAGIDDVDDAAKYPAFAYAKSRGEGWMVPNGIALSYIHENKDAINTTLTELGEPTLADVFLTSLPFDMAGLFYRNMAINISRGLPDYSRLRERNATGALSDFADRTDSTRNLIAVKVISL